MGVEGLGWAADRMCVLLGLFHSAPTYANTMGRAALFVEVRSM
jgi:hypothetical protein